MTQIYRIEGEKGIGPYQYSGGGRPAIDAWNKREGREETDLDKHPIPYYDTRLTHEVPNDLYWTDCLFGFESVAALRRWFYEDQVLLDLDELGFALKIYEGEVYHGNTQSVIRKGTERLVKIESLFSLIG